MHYIICDESCTNCRFFVLGALVLPVHNHGILEAELSAWKSGHKLNAASEFKWTKVSRAACPNLKSEIAALFPDAFEDSELGEVPRLWRVGTIADIASNPRRCLQPSQIGPTTPYIALEHMPRRCITLSEWGHGDGLESGKFRSMQGEILFGKLRPYFHKVGVAPVEGVCSTDILVIAPTAPEWFGFLLGHVCSAQFISYADSVSTGTKMPRTNWQDMARYQVALPPEGLAWRSADLVSPFIQRIAASIHEARTLAALRDALLPKLISGELRVPDPDRVAGRAL